MNRQADILRCVMSETSTSQSDLARLSGVHQPSISQALSGSKRISDDLLDRLLSAMGRQLEVSRRAVEPSLNRSERSSWLLHRGIAANLNSQTLEAWRPAINQNLARLRNQATGQPHERNIERWKALIDAQDLMGIRRVLMGLDQDAIEMREVSPMSGVLSQAERDEILKGRAG